MYFSTLEVKNFGPFPEYKTSFSPNGVNIVVGPNESGKTQLIGAIVFSLLGKSVVDITPMGNLPSEVNLSICEEQITEIINSRYDKNNPEIQIFKRTSAPSDSGNMVLANYLRNVLKNHDGPQLLLSYDRTLDFSLSKKEIDIISNFQWQSKEIQDSWNELQQGLASREGSLSHLSEGYRSIAAFLKEYLYRKNTNRSIPLIIDDFISIFDSAGMELISKLIDDICQRDQVIILTFPGVNLSIKDENIKTQQNIIFSPSKDISSLSYNYFPRQVLRKANATEYDGHQFVRGQQIHVEENRYYEFKEIKGNNPIRSIINIVDDYAVAFLNMGRKGVGRIYWGVTDDGNVVGVNLNVKERDELRRLVTEKLHQIEPPVAPSAYEINLYPVVDYDEEDLNLFLVEVKIPSSKSEYLFSTGKGEVYIKTDGGRKKLSPQEIQREILERHHK